MYVLMQKVFSQCLSLSFPSNFNAIFKNTYSVNETESVVLHDPPSKDINARFPMITLKPLSDQ